MILDLFKYGLSLNLHLLYFPVSIPVFVASNRLSRIPTIALFLLIISIPISFQISAVHFQNESHFTFVNSPLFYILII